MFGSVILDVLIGLVTIFLILSLVASAIREAIETGLKTRAVMLEQGIRELLGDPSGSGIVKRFYEHPLIFPLFRGDFVPKSWRILGHRLPTYIPSATFAAAIFDIALRGQRAGPYAAAQTTPVITIDELRRSVGRLPNAQLRHAVTTAIDNAQGDLTKVRTNLESWFDAAMERVSGRYKRQTQLYLFVLGALLAGLLNVNSIAIANHLWADKAARDRVVRRAELLQKNADYVKSINDTTAKAQRIADAYEDLASLDLPIGWNQLPPRRSGMGNFDYNFQIVTGILITAFALTLGAPFWFDTLNKIVMIRSTVKPDQKSGQVASDVTPTSKPVQVVVGAPGAAQPGAAAAAQPGAPAVAPSGPSPSPELAALLDSVQFTPRQWAIGNPDEGIL